MRLSSSSGSPQTGSQTERFNSEGAEGKVWAVAEVFCFPMPGYDMVAWSRKMVDNNASAP